ncbi:UbiA family prenyltransferase [uncultured Maribacter sp.]|uniref:UbiA family prenyltransferase n=1 Tax=uncultured Maribacter sp. TaxID=431308 RepID=UPI0026325AEC|nr:UbiA family prenyltransferase [uncultured Maribacter sp.]
MSNFLNNVLFHIKISRPGLWFPTIWIYLVPFSGKTTFWNTIPFWVGLFFVTFPLNYLVYGLNDYNDVKADAVNKRKGNFLFGASASKEELKGLLQKIGAVILPFIVWFSVTSGFYMLLLLVFMVLINMAYNFEPFRIKERPPFEIFIQVGYVTTALFSIQLNNLPELPWQTLVYLALFAFQAHIAGEIMDIEPDVLAGKKTTAGILGRKKSKMLMTAIVLLEAFLVWFWFQDIVLALFLAFFSIWLLLDVLIFFKDKPYTLSQMKLFGYAINISAILSMFWVLYSGKLLMP